MLINNTAELKNFIPTSVSLEFDDIKPHLEQAEVKISNEFLTLQILSFLTNTEVLTVEEQRVKSLLSSAVALLALRDYLDFGQLDISSSGIHFHSSDNKKTAFEWQINNLKKTCLIQAYTKLELIYPYVPLVSNDLKTLFEASPFYIQSKGLLLNSVKEFTNSVSIQSSTVFYFRLLNSIIEAEQNLKDQLGNNLFALLFELPNDPEKKAAIQKISIKAKRYAAYLALSTGIVENALILGEYGVQLLNGTFSRLTDSTMTADRAMIEFMQNYYSQQAQNALAELLALCQSLAVIVPEYQESSNYLSDNSSHVYRNPTDNSIMFF